MTTVIFFNKKLHVYTRSVGVRVALGSFPVGLFFLEKPFGWILPAKIFDLEVQKLSKEEGCLRAALWPLGLALLLGTQNATRQDALFF